MQEEKQEKLPLDAKLLSDAVIELNISRRSVGLYPSDHPIAKESIERAFGYLLKLFELRCDIALGITKNTLVVDEYTLDKRNPVFTEFAASLHTKGIAAVTFSSGATKEELTAFHELLTLKDSPTGTALVELAKGKNISHIRLIPIDFSALGFIEGAQRVGGKGSEVWEEYVYGLLQGKLAGDGESIIQSLPPEDMAFFINSAITEDTEDEAYDRVITTYLKKKGEQKLSSESIERFMTFINELKPEIKRQFLSRSSDYFTGNISDVEKTIKEMTPEGFQRLAGIFTDHSSLIPDTLKNLIDKLTAIKKGSKFEFDLFDQANAVVHDIELGEDIMRLFDEDHFKAYVSDGYKRDLEKMLKVSATGGLKLAQLRDDCKTDVIDRTLSGVMLELLDTDYINDEENLKLVTKLSEFVNILLETGRFEEILEIYNTLKSQALGGRFSRNASSMIEYFFRSEAFITKLVEAFRLLGRKGREDVIRLARAFKLSIINHLLDILVEESDASVRKFLLSILESLGSDVNSYVVQRLEDERWYVVRNMLYLLRECNGRQYAAHIKKLAKHKNINICIEAVKTLLHFKTNDAIPFLKLYLQNPNTELRTGMIRLAGTYRIKEAVPYLTEFLEKKDIFGTESFFRIDIVKALGEIGDRGAAGSLLKVIRARTLFYKGYLEELKLEIFKNLDNYPYDSIKPLLELGIMSKNQEIRNISERFMRENNDTPKK